MGKATAWTWDTRDSNGNLSTGQTSTAMKITATKYDFIQFQQFMSQF